MIIYSTQFPVKSEFDKKTFVELLREWNSGGHDKFENFEWDGETYSFTIEEQNKKLIVEDLREEGITAARFETQNEKGVWKADFILNGLNERITVTLMHETNEFTTDFYPVYKAPFFVKQIVWNQYAGDDAGLTVRNSAYAYDEYKDIVDAILSGQKNTYLPLVMVTKKNTGEIPINLQSLGKLLQGAAHIVYETDGADFSVYTEEFGFNAGYGSAIIVYPHKNRQRKVINLFGANNESPEVIEKLIQDAVYAYGRETSRSNLDTWEGVVNQKLYVHNKSLLSDKDALKKENDDLYLEFGAQLDEDKQRNEDLLKEIQNLRSENSFLRSHLNDKSGAPVINSGEEKNFYPDEIKEIILEILENYTRNADSDTRRYHVVRDILENNDYRKLQGKRREEIKTALKSYNGLTSALEGFLKRFGFVITVEGTHYKWTYYGDHRYMVAASKTPSDHRTGKNAFSEINKKML